MAFFYECGTCGNVHDFDPRSDNFDPDDFELHCDDCGELACADCLTITEYNETICGSCENDRDDYRDPFDEEETERNDEGD